MGFFDKLKSGLKKTKDNFLGKVDTILAGFGKIDEDLFEELEYVLISSYFGVQTTEEILDKLRAKVKENKLTEASQIRIELQKIISHKLAGTICSLIKLHIFMKNLLFCVFCYLKVFNFVFNNNFGHCAFQCPFSLQKAHSSVPTPTLP